MQYSEFATNETSVKPHLLDCMDLVLFLGHVVLTPNGIQRQVILMSFA